MSRHDGGRCVRRFLAVAGCLGATLAALPEATALADDEPETATLTYVASGAATARCPDEESFRNQVAARLGYQPFNRSGKHRVAVTLDAALGRVRGRAEVIRSGQTTAGVRELDDKIDKCEVVASALATTVAIAIDPVRGLRAPTLDPSIPASPARPEPTPATPAPDTKTPPTPAAPPSTPRHESRVVVFGVLGGLASLGLTPGPSVGGYVGAGFRVGAFSLELSGLIETMPGTTRLDSGDKLETTVFSALLAPCGHLGRWSACALGRVGALQGRAPDVVDPNLGTSFFGAVGARAGYTLPISSIVALRALASAEIPLVRTSLLINRAAVWTAAPLIAGLEFGAVFSLP